MNHEATCTLKSNPEVYDEIGELTAYAIELAEELAEEIEPFSGRGGEFDWKYLFLLARRLKSDINLPRLEDGDYAIKIFKSAVKAFARRIVELEKENQFVDFDDFDDCWDRFIDAWHKVIHNEGDNPLDTAYELALDHPITLKNDMGSVRLARLASTAYHLQQLNGDRNIVLPVELVGKRFHKTKRDGSRLISLLLQTGLVIKVRDYNHGLGQASEYRFQLDRTDLYRPPK